MSTTNDDNLTSAEYSELYSATCAAEWSAACDAVKRARGGQYPSDWYARIIAPGIPTKVSARFGGSAEMRLMVNR